MGRIGLSAPRRAINIPYLELDDTRDVTSATLIAWDNEPERSSVAAEGRAIFVPGEEHGTIAEIWINFPEGEHNLVPIASCHNDVFAEFIILACAIELQANLLEYCPKPYASIAVLLRSLAAHKLDGNGLAPQLLGLVRRELPRLLHKASNGERIA